jgi:hypothetical protein
MGEKGHAAVAAGQAPSAGTADGGVCGGVGGGVGGNLLLPLRRSGFLRAAFMLFSGDIRVESS